jgi:hypothetical protein
MIGLRRDHQPMAAGAAGAELPHQARIDTSDAAPSIGPGSTPLVGGTAVRDPPPWLRDASHHVSIRAMTAACCESSSDVLPAYRLPAHVRALQRQWPVGRGYCGIFTRGGRRARKAKSRPGRRRALVSRCHDPAHGE